MLSLSANADFKRISDFTITNEYYDWDAYGTSKEVWGKNAVDQMIENILLTEPMERLFNLDYGSPLYTLLFENFSEVDRLMPYVFAIIEKWVPIKIDRKNAEIEKDEDNHALSFRIDYTTNNGLIKGTFARRILQ